MASSYYNYQELPIHMVQCTGSFDNYHVAVAIAVLDCELVSLRKLERNWLLLDMRWDELYHYRGHYRYLQMIRK